MQDDICVKERALVSESKLEVVMDLASRSEVLGVEPRHYWVVTRSLGKTCHPLPHTAQLLHAVPVPNSDGNGRVVTGSASGITPVSDLTNQMIQCCDS